MPTLHCHYPAFNYSVSGRGAEKHWFLMSNEGDCAYEMLRAFSQNTRGGGMENIYVFNEFLHERKQESVKEHITARIQGKRRNYGHIYTCINMRFR